MPSGRRAMRQHTAVGFPSRLGQRPWDVAPSQRVDALSGDIAYGASIRRVEQGARCRPFKESTQRHYFKLFSERIVRTSLGRPFDCEIASSDGLGTFLRHFLITRLTPSPTAT